MTNSSIVRALNEARLRDLLHDAERRRMAAASASTPVDGAGPTTMRTPERLRSFVAARRTARRRRREVAQMQRALLAAITPAARDELLVAATTPSDREARGA